MSKIHTYDDFAKERDLTRRFRLENRAKFADKKVCVCIYLLGALLYIMDRDIGVSRAFQCASDTHSVSKAPRN